MGKRLSLEESMRIAAWELEATLAKRAVKQEKYFRQRELSVPEDVRRVMELPEVDYAADARKHLDRYHQLYRKTRVDVDGRPVALLAQQAAVLRCLEREENCIVPLQPGEGKTLASFLGPGHLEASGILLQARPLLVVPANLRQKTFADLITYGRDWRIVPPEVTSYAMLSRRPYLLEDGQFNVFVFDEAHKLKDMKSARTKRVLTTLIEHPSVKVIILTASFYGEGLHNSAHWLDSVLRQNSPIPMSKTARTAWAKVLDIRLGDDEAYPHQGSMEGLRRKYAPEVRGRKGCRVAFARRLACCPGIVMGEPDDRVESNLILAIEEDFEINNACKEAIKEVKDTGTRPDGEILPDATQSAQVCRNLSVGFYYRWIWPDDIPDLEWLDARRRWHKSCREELAGEHVKGYDTEALVVKGILSGESTDELLMTYADWVEEDARLGGEPPKEAVWLDPTVPGRVMDLAARFDKPAIVWVQSDAMQLALVEAGYKLYKGNELPPSKPTEQVCVMPWRAHGEGKNLQGWSRALIVEPPGGPTTWEQLLAREHRRGQRDDEVIYATLAHTEQLARSLTTAVELSCALQDQNGVSQRLAYCDKISASEVWK